MLRSLLKQDVEAERIFEQAICEMCTRTPRMSRDGVEELVRHSAAAPDCCICEADSALVGFEVLSVFDPFHYVWQ